MKFAVINTEIDKLVQPHNYYFVVKQDGELWTVNHDLSFSKADEKYKVISERELPTEANNNHKTKQLNIADVRCFKTYGENIIKELGFELTSEYDHDQFHTNRYRKGLLMVEFTYDGPTLETVDLIIDETFCKPITYTELQALSPILGEIPE